MKLTAKDAGSYTVLVNASLPSSKTFTGKKLNPSVEVKDGLQVLVNGSDYSLIYKNNTKVGTAFIEFPSTAVRRKDNHNASV